jgi:hypothetical protein
LRYNSNNQKKGQLKSGICYNAGKKILARGNLVPASEKKLYLFCSVAMTVLRMKNDVQDLSHIKPMIAYTVVFKTSPLLIIKMYQMAVTRHSHEKIEDKI